MRKNICRDQQIDDFLAYQRRRQEKPSLPELPAVVFVVDKFIEFKQAFDKEMDLLLAIARFGHTYGVYLILSVDRPIAVPSQLMSLIDLRVGLRLVELTDSLIFLGKNDAAHLDPALDETFVRSLAQRYQVSAHTMLLRLVRQHSGT